ncbi:hypothetical protein WMY93_033421 [Mugilogobius chulae]|uniref:Stress-associated endoplasmic reticulum protein n=1 Tax=Mugilogobius chulae TaxID=88201 RepID=A0AAW0MN13_9GOBI
MVAKQRIRMANEKHSKNITQRGNVTKSRGLWRTKVWVRGCSLSSSSSCVDQPFSRSSRASGWACNHGNHALGAGPRL